MANPTFLKGKNRLALFLQGEYGTIVTAKLCHLCRLSVGIVTAKLCHSKNCLQGEALCGESRTAIPIVCADFMVQWLGMRFIHRQRFGVRRLMERRGTIDR